MEIKKTYNPLTLSRDYQTFENEGLSPNQFLEKENIIFTRPVILLVNGAPVLRESWNVELKKNDVCHFVELPRGGGGESDPLQMVALVALVAVAWWAGAAVGGGLMGAVVQGAIMVGGSLIINSFLAENLPQNQQLAADTMGPIDVFNLNANSNRIRLGQPFAEHFGRFICYPDLVMAPYVKYIGNEQYFYMIGIIGIGTYNIENVYIGGASISNFVGSSYDIIQPAGDPTICPNIVYSNIIGLELDTDWVAAIASPPNVLAYKFEFDIVCPSGLHIVNSSTGAISTCSVDITLQIREIDVNGNALSAWVAFFTKNYSASTRDPLRHTIEKITLTGNGRYEFRFKRDTEKSTDPLISDSIFLETMRAFGPDHPDYGDVTLFEAKLLATDQLNSDAANRINIVCTRELYPVTETGFGVTKVASKCVVDACAYIVTADNGGKQPDSVLDFESLNDLKTILAANENYFNHRFINQTIVMSACGIVAMCGRSVPYMPGGLFSLVQDKLQTVATQVYTDDDYTEGTLNLNHVIRTDDDATCVEMSYVDPETWQTEAVTYYDVGGSDENPSKLNLIGCTDRQHAYKEAAYLYKSDELNRTNITFTTGLKGHLPKLGDMIYVSSRHVDWGQTGQLAHISSLVATLSEPVDFEEAEEGKLLLTSKTGGILGPYTVTPEDASHQVGVALTSSIVNTIHSQGLTATKFVFGLTVDEILRVRILKIRPSSNNEVQIIGSIVNDEVFDDPGTVPELIIIQPDDSDVIIDDPDPTDGAGYIYGGNDTQTIGDEIQDCDKYTPPNTWLAVTNIPVPKRDYLAASTIGSSSYIYGGHDGTNELQDCDEYTPDIWVSKSDMPLPARCGLAASTIGDSGYIYGGSYTRDCDQYTPNVWASKTNIPTVLGWHGSCASTIGSSGYIYGYDPGAWYAEPDCYQYTPDTWTSKADMIVPWRYYAASSSVGTNAYIFGGDDYGESPFLDCDEFNPALNLWTSKADLLNVGRCYLAASTIGDSIYIYGGTSMLVAVRRDCDEYLLNTWTSRSDIPLPARCNLAASTII